MVRSKCREPGRGLLACNTTNKAAVETGPPRPRSGINVTVSIDDESTIANRNGQRQSQITSLESKRIASRDAMIKTHRVSRCDDQNASRLAMRSYRCVPQAYRGSARVRSTDEKWRGCARKSSACALHCGD